MATYRALKGISWHLIHRVFHRAEYARAGVPISEFVKDVWDSRK